MPATSPVSGYQPYLQDGYDTRAGRVRAWTDDDSPLALASYYQQMNNIDGDSDHNQGDEQHMLVPHNVRGDEEPDTPTLPDEDITYMEAEQSRISSPAPDTLKRALSQDDHGNHEVVETPRQWKKRRIQDSQTLAKENRQGRTWV